MTSHQDQHISPGEMRNRKKANLVGLPKICSSRVCRRTKVCSEKSQHCMLDHMILCQRRWSKMSRRGIRLE